MADRRKDVAAGAGVAGGAALIGAPGAGVAVINRGRRIAGVRRMNREIGTLGGLTSRDRPVDPGGLSSHRGRPTATGRPSDSPREAAQARFETAKVGHLRRIAGSKLKGRAGAAVVGAQLATGVGAAGLGLRHFERRNTNAVGKAADYFTDPALSPMNLVGIPPQRAQPVDPLQMQAASSIMAGVLVGASGRRLTRRERKAIRSGAYRFVGAQHMVVTPTGFRGLVTS